MGKRIKAPRGTNDFFGARGERLQRIQEVAVEVFRLYGFTPVRTPVFEATELFQRHIGETTDVVMKEMYTFEDRKGRSMTLRPEGTAPVVRSLVQHGFLQEGCDRVWYAGPMFRYERPQAGRYRQHYQLGVEAFGDPTPECDAEVIACFLALLEGVGLDDLEVRIHSVGMPESRARYGQALRDLLGEAKEELCGACVERLERNPMRILDCKGEACRAKVREAPPFLDYLDDADRQHFEDLKKALEALGARFQVDPFLVRGFDYYTRTAFEVVSHRLGAQDAVGGGGRYDLLVEQLGGPPTPAMGFATGIERIMLTLEKHEQEPPPRPGPGLVYVVCPDEAAREEAVGLAAELRRGRIPVRVHYQGGKMGKQLQAADRRGARWAIVLGERERAEGKVALKDLRSGEQQAVVREDLWSHVTGVAALRRDAEGK